MLSLGLMLLLGGIAAYFRAKGWMIALAAFVGALIGGSVWWALLPLIAGVVCCLPFVKSCGELSSYCFSARYLILRNDVGHLPCFFLS